MAEASVIKDFLVALGFQTDNAGLGQMREAMSGLELKAKALNATLMALATGAVIAIKQTASELDKLYFSSQRIGASATNITAYGNAIAQLGGNAEGAINTLENLAEKLRNSPGHEGMINSLGVQTKDANGQIRDRVEVMQDLSSVLAKMPSYQANNYASALGIDQNTLLAMKDGKFLSNMEKYKKIQKELGMNDQLTKSGNDFMTEYQDLTMVMKSGFQVIIMQAGKALIPILKLINQWVQSGIHAFSQLNPEIKNMLGVGMRFALLAVVMGGFIKTFGLLFKFVPLLKGLIGIWRAFNLAFLASPVGIILGLAAALALLWDDYNNWKDGGESLINWSNWTEDIEGAFAVLKDIQNKIVEFKNKAIEVFNALDPSIQDLIKNVLKFGVIGVLFAKFGGATKVLHGAKSALVGLSRAAKLMLKAFKFTPIGRAVALIGLLIGAVNFLMKDFEKWKNGERSLIDWNKWSSNIDKVMQKIRDFLNLLNNIKDKVINFVQKIVRDPVGAIKEIASIAGEEVKKVAESLNEGKSGEVIKTLTEVSKNIAEGASSLIGKGLNAVSDYMLPNEAETQQKLPSRKTSEIEPNVMVKQLPMQETMVKDSNRYIALPEQSNSSKISQQANKVTPKGSKALADFAQSSLIHSLTENVQTITNKGIELFTGVATSTQKAIKETVAVNKNSFSHFIGKGEGGYNDVNLGKKHKYKSAKRALTTMTVDQVYSMQKSREVNAVGKFQIIRDTMPDIIKGMKLTGKEKFDEEMQEKMGAWLLFNKRKDLSNYLKGKHNDLNLAGDDGAREWASLPVLSNKLVTTSGKNTFHSKRGSTAYSDGVNKALHSPDSYEQTLKEAKSNYQNAIKSGLSESEAQTIAFRGSAAKLQVHSKNQPVPSYEHLGVNIRNIAPPIVNPDKSQVNSSNSHLTASNVTINQNFKTDMTINGAATPMESAKAVKNQQEHSLSIMARNAKGVLA